jgi:sensor histidine kinase regulating citrate/malate metabolism
VSLRGRLLLAIGYVLLIALVAFVVPLAINTSNRVDSEVRAQATAQADLLSVAAAEELPEGADAIDPLVDVAAKAVRGRVIVVDEQGRLVSDSAGETAGTDFANRPEIQSALAGESFQGERESTTLGMDLTATSAPMIAGGQVVGAVRITQSTEAES